MNEYYFKPYQIKNKINNKEFENPSNHLFAINEYYKNIRKEVIIKKEKRFGELEQELPSEIFFG